MNYQENISLSTLTTMRLGGVAKYVVEITTQDDLLKVIAFARQHNLPWFVLGSGSNVVAKGDFNGIIILNRIKGFEKLSEDKNSVTYKIGAGEVWDSVVERLVVKNLSGVEAMSDIPGCAGSTPIQNVGAYGQEIADVLVDLDAFDTNTDQFVTLNHDDCEFSYRNSIFKNPETRHHIITSITLRLSKELPQPPFYRSLNKYFVESSITDYSPTNIRAAVIAIRGDKLPDPTEIASAGSFFKNPIVSRETAEKLLSEFPDVPHWSMSNDQEKLAAGWLIEQAGLKSYSAHGMQIYPKNALVVTNISAQSAVDLEKFKSEIIARVQEKFGVILEQEPENL